MVSTNVLGPASFLVLAAYTCHLSLVDFQSLHYGSLPLLRYSLNVFWKKYGNKEANRLITNMTALNLRAIVNMLNPYARLAKPLIILEVAKPTWRASRTTERHASIAKNHAKLVVKK